MASLREIDDTFCIAVLGDFLGAASHTADGRQASWVPRRATPDTVTRLLGLHPELHADRLGLPEPVRVSFADLDSFRPQSLFRRLDLFAPLRQARESAAARP